MTEVDHLDALIDTHGQPEQFDLAGWLAGVQPAERAVVVYQRPDLMAQADELTHAHQLAKRLPATDQSLGESSPAALAARLRELHSQLENSRLVIKLRALSADRLREITKQVRKQHPAFTPEDQQDEATLQMIAESVKTPTLSLETARQLRTALGTAQWNQVVNMFNEVCAGAVAIAVPFSPPSYDAD
jgi:hypothetical protein